MKTRDEEKDNSGAQSRWVRSGEVMSSNVLYSEGSMVRYCNVKLGKVMYCIFLEVVQ